jgi:hypothetical protein
MKTLPYMIACGAVAVAVLAGCRRSSDTAPAAPAAEHAGHAGKHVHRPLMGGTLVEVGEHQFNLEFVRQAETGALTAYVLSAHAENFVRVPLKAFDVAIEAAGRTETLTFVAQANPISEETVGDTSTFAAQAEWLKTTAAFKGRVLAIELGDTLFRDIVFTFPVNEDHDEP